MEYLAVAGAAILFFHGIKKITTKNPDTVMATPAGFPPGTTPGKAATPAPQQSAGGQAGMVHEISTQEEFVNAAMSPNGAFLAITADWCGHCKAMKDDFYTAAASSPVPFYWVDTKDFSEDDLDGIEGFPTLRFYREGQGKNHEGDRSSSAMLEFVHSMV